MQALCGSGWIHLMKKEEHNDNDFGIKRNLICIFRILYISYSVYTYSYSHFLFCIFCIL